MSSNFDMGLRACDSSEIIGIWVNVNGRRSLFPHHYTAILADGRMGVVSFEEKPERVTADALLQAIDKGNNLSNSQYQAGGRTGGWKRYRFEENRLTIFREDGRHAEPTLSPEVKRAWIVEVPAPGVYAISEANAGDLILDNVVNWSDGMMQGPRPVSPPLLLRDHLRRLS